MVIVKLMGGLGNQMFQYACARRLSAINGIPLKLDISGLVDNPSRRFELRRFKISAEIASPEDLRRFKKPYLLRSFLIRARLAKKGYLERSVVRERFFHFDQSILSLRGEVYLDGYWQSEKYFQDIGETIRAEFSFKTEPDGKNASLAETIRETNSISVHVRRGDYVRNPTTNFVHGTCSVDYYRRAARWIADRNKDAHFYIFSDEPGWASENLMLDYDHTEVRHNQQESSFEDLRLMSLCKHHIIANSSFSWWAAWLHKRTEKQVIAPARWFNAEQYNSADVVPQDWHKM